MERWRPGDQFTVLGQTWELVIPLRPGDRDLITVFDGAMLELLKAARGDGDGAREWLITHVGPPRLIGVVTGEFLRDAVGLDRLPASEVPGSAGTGDVAPPG